LDQLGLSSDAAPISSYLYTDCPLAVPLQACSEACESIPLAISSCNSKAECVCPSLTVLGPPCTSCLSSLGLTAAYSTVVSDLLIASGLCALVPKIEICSNECGSVGNAVSFCSPNDQCLCPTLSVLAPACISCAASLGDTTYAATLSSFLATDCHAAAASTPHIPTATVSGGGTTATVTATATTTTGASQTTGAKSGAQGFSLSYISKVLVVLVVVGSVSLFL
jgi:hypothetical protein